MSVRELSCDACVVGGGPAGSVVATRLARLGRRVVLVERAAFPRPRLGESLTPGVRPMLDTIEAGYVLDGAGAVPVARVHRLWGDSRESRVDPRAEGRLVDRATFDAGLLLHARLHGVTVVQPARITHESRDASGWTLGVEGGGEASTVRARVLVRAAGRSGRGGVAREASVGPRTLALHAYWSGDVPREPAIESLADGWAWGVPVPGRGYNVLVFVDAAMSKGGDPAAVYEAALSGSRLVAPGRGGHRVTPVHASDATPGVSVSPVDEASLRVGDAALALDPLSSSGVQQAIQHALAGAIVANTFLGRADLAGAAREAWTGHVTRAARRHAGWAATHYASVAAGGARAFWTDRARDAAPEAPAEAPVPMAAGIPLALSPHATLRHIPVFEEEFVAIRPAVHPPALEEPVAFIGGHPIDRLLDAVTPGVTAEALVARWDLAPALGHRIAGWMHRVGLLVPATAQA